MPVLSIRNILLAQCLVATLAAALPLLPALLAGTELGRQHDEQAHALDKARAVADLSAALTRSGARREHRLLAALAAETRPIPDRAPVEAAIERRLRGLATLVGSGRLDALYRDFAAANRVFEQQAWVAGAATARLGAALEGVAADSAPGHGQVVLRREEALARASLAHAATAVEEASAQLLETIEGVAAEASAGGAARRDEAHATLARARYVGGFVLLGVIVVMSCCAAAACRLLGGPLHEVVHALHEVAAGDGDLRRRLVPPRVAELAALAREYNAFAHTMHQLVGDVAEGIGQVLQSVDRSVSAARRSGGELEAQERGTAEIAAAIAEIGTSVAEVAERAGAASHAAASAQRQAGDGGHLVAQSARAVLALAAEVEQVGAILERVAADSENAGMVLAVIEDIADQTGLLALNATIEAARAGEQGRGLSVVAAEVRSLARRAGDSAHEVRDLVQRLQRGTKAARNAVRQGRAQAERSVTATATTREALAAIDAAVSTIGTLNGQIATATDHQLAAVDTLEQEIGEIAAAASRTAARTRTGACAGAQLAASVQHLESVVERIRA